MLIAINQLKVHVVRPGELEAIKPDGKMNGQRGARKFGCRTSGEKAFLVPDWRLLGVDGTKNFSGLIGKE
jgi:hypothetical protein